MPLTEEQAATAGLSIMEARAILSAPSFALPTPYEHVNAVRDSLRAKGLTEDDPTPGSSWKYRLTEAGKFKRLWLESMEKPA